MEHYDNEQRLRILQERLNQIKDKQTSNFETDRDNDNNPPYPTYNPKATESSDVDINLPNRDSEYLAILIVIGTCTILKY